MQILLDVFLIYRVCKLLMQDDCPYEVCAKFRDFIGINYDEQSEPYSDNELGKLFLCIWCLSLWVALVYTKMDIKKALAYSGMVGFIDGISK